MIPASFRAAVRRTRARLMQIRAAASGERRFLCELVYELMNGGDAADGSGRPASNDDVHAVYLLESEQRLTAFYGLAERGADGELRFLFIDREIAPSDAAERLWRHAVETARGLGFGALFIRAKTAASAFFTSMGAERMAGSREGDSELYRYPLKPDAAA